ncbi:MAG: D-glycero-beta-D-manno-heptose-7-phosphate kinase [bacterium]|nr:D-glycero-beta-D-manno-heptose-7-phosphate kinase [bacterium]
MTRSELRNLIARMKGRKILVVGDLMIDEYVWGTIDRISPEAPIQIVDVQSRNTNLGGAANVVGNLTSLGAQVYLAGIVGRDANGTLLKQRLQDEHVRVQGMVSDPHRPTSTKTRIMCQNQQLLRIDEEEKQPLGGTTEERLVRYIEKQVPACDGVILSDYGKGVLTRRICAAAIGAARKARCVVTADPKGKDYRRYRGVTCLTPNRRETEEATGLTLGRPGDIRRAASALQKLLRSRAALITLGKDGMALLDGKVFKSIPTVAREVYDVTGAGDTVIAVLTLAAAAGCDFETAARLANRAAGVVVGKVGAARVTPQELLDYEHQGGDPRDFKILELGPLEEKVKGLREQGKQVVFTNGCFDLLHVGHIRYLQEARKRGDCLIIGLNSDASVRRLKGKERPLISQDERAHILSALDCVDHVIVFNELTPLKLIRRLKPDCLVKGGDYTKSQVVGADIVESYGGRVELIPVVQGRSTSDIVTRIVQRYGGHGPGKTSAKRK